jgi:hypothetical protein
MKTYKVSGTQPVFGNRPGSTFQADLPANQEAHLLQGGALKVVEPPTPPAPPAASTAPRETTTPPKAPASDDDQKKEGR